MGRPAIAPYSGTDHDGDDITLRRLPLLRSDTPGVAPSMCYDHLWWRRGKFALPSSALQGGSRNKH